MELQEQQRVVNGTDSVLHVEETKPWNAPPSPPAHNAALYSTYARHQRKIGFRLLAEHYAAISSLAYPCRVLDVGCGTGETTRLLAYFPNVDRVVAVDRSADMLAVAETFNSDERLTFVLADVETEQGMPPSDGDPFDLVCAMEFFHLLDDVDAALRVVADRLRPGGLLIGYALSRQSDSVAAVNDYLRRTSGKQKHKTVTPVWYNSGNPETVFGEILEEHGFRVLSCTLEEDRIISSRSEALGSLGMTNPMADGEELSDQAIDVYLSGLDKLSEDRYSETLQILVFFAQKLK